MFTKVLHERLSLKNYPVKIYAIHPGIIRSALWTQHWFANIGYLTTKLIAKVRRLRKSRDTK
jgi:dehydrogenase/reductase SDR family protein X